MAEEKNNEQVKKLAGIADPLLADLMRLIQSGEATAADRKLAYQMLRDAGWQLNLDNEKPDVKEFMSKVAGFDEDEFDDGIVGRIA